MYTFLIKFKIISGEGGGASDRLHSGHSQGGRVQPKGGFQAGRALVSF